MEQEKKVAKQPETVVELTQGDLETLAMSMTEAEAQALINRYAEQAKATGGLEAKFGPWPPQR